LIKKSGMTGMTGMTVEHEIAGMIMKDSMRDRQASDMGMRV